MSKLNPLYIVGALLVLVALIYGKVNQTRQAITATKKAIATTKSTGEYLKAMRSEFASKQEQMRVIRNIMAKYALQNPPHVLEVGTDKAILKAFNLDSATTAQLTSRVLNASLEVVGYEVEDINFSKAIRIEFKL